MASEIMEICWDDLSDHLFVNERVEFEMLRQSSSDIDIGQ
jgi:hypothetical protein